MNAAASIFGYRGRRGDCALRSRVFYARRVLFLCRMKYFRTELDCKITLEEERVMRERTSSLPQVERDLDFTYYAHLYFNTLLLTPV